MASRRINAQITVIIFNFLLQQMCIYWIAYAVIAVYVQRLTYQLLYFMFYYFLNLSSA